ncbi:MAG: zinc-dependent dehydrogenase [Candidatus Omnitrophica bacterium]|nr:zinc-dependent dehydrogenase [Candidatus Omnitrophota bacterium]
MRVAMYYNNRDLRLQEMPKPEIGPGELLVKVLASGICGTDVLEWYRIKKAPLVLGHEITGEIAEIGEGVEGYKVGDRVFVSHHVPCNTCRCCLSGHHTACETLHTTNYDPGGFAEYIRVPKLNTSCGVFLLPDNVSFDQGTFIEPLACVVRAQRLALFKPQESLLILGSGISGLLHLLLARAQGARRIIMTDINQERLRAARQLGAELAIDAREDLPLRLRQANEERLADLVVVATGALSAFAQALQCVERGGTVLFFASTDAGVNLPLPVDKFWRREIKLMTSYANSPSDAEAAIELISSGRIPVDRMITHRLSLEEAGLGFGLVAEGRESIKVIIHPDK